LALPVIDLSDAASLSDRLWNMKSSRARTPY
jgi:hypothetical protein